MRTKSQRWGKGVASKIPKPSASEARLDQQSEVDVFVVADALAIKPCLEPAWSVEELLSK
jgi:antitoxin component of MazEF toxin-antitoxin module